MSDELDIQDEERRLGELFAAVPAPETLRGRWGTAAVVGAPGGRAGRLLGRLLIGAPGERRLRPLAAALLVPVLALAVAGGFGLRARLSSTAGPAANPEARAGAAMAFDAARGDVVMFGGTGDGGHPLADTWTWNGSGWTRQQPGTSPPALQNPALAFDARSGRVLLVGSMAGPAEDGPAAQTWSWDGSTWHREQPAHTPSWGFGGMAADRATGQVVLVTDGVPAAARLHAPAPAATPGVLHGGPVAATPAVGPSLETWTWNGSDWVDRGAAGAPGGGFPGFRLAWDASSHRVLLLSVAPGCASVAGGSAPSIQGRLSAPAPTFAPGTPIPPGAAAAGTSMATALPTAHATPASAGQSGAVPPQVDAVPPVLVPIQVCNLQSSSSDSSSGTAVRCSPCSGASVSAWDGSAWHSVAAPQAPYLPLPGAAADDPATGGVLVTAMGRSWTLAGGRASLHGGLTSPLGLRTQEALAADPSHHDVVLFGGSIGGSLGADTWTWDGSKWTHRAGPTLLVPSPPVAVGGPVDRGRVCTFPQAIADGEAATPGGVDYTFPSAGGPCGAEPVKVTLLDSSGQPLAVKGNGATLPPWSAINFRWTNWCGSANVQVQFLWKEMTAQRDVKPPSCANSSAPSLLIASTGHPAVHP